MTVRVFQEGERISADDHPVAKAIGLLCPRAIKDSSGAISFAFSGIATVEDTIVVSVPKGFDINATRANYDRLREVTLLTLRSIMKYKADNPLDILGDEALDGSIGSERFYLALQIIEDYFSRGLVNRMRSVVRQSNAGNTAWQKTIARSTAIHASSGVLYERPYTRRLAVDSEDLLRHIQAHVVKDCFEFLGWLLPVKEPAELRGASLNWRTSDFLAALDREKISTFSQRELRLIDLLSNYLRDSALSHGADKAVLFGTLNFEKVWECACKVAFNDKHALQSMLVPQPKWHKESGVDGLVFDKHARQIPDVLSIQDSVLLVLDAKYYNTAATLPGWQDIVKQIYYQDTIERKLNRFENMRNKLGVNCTANAFVFPGESGAPVRYVGYVDIPSLSDENRWGCVDAYLADISACLSAYLKNAPRRDWMASIGARHRSLIG